MAIIDDADFEIKFYEGILEKKGDFLEALMALGDLYTKTGLYEKGLKIDEKLVQLKPRDPIVFYNISCSYSLLNRIEDASAAMKKAIDFGYANFNYLEQDSDLANLLNDAGFLQYFSEVKNNKREAKS